MSLQAILRISLILSLFFGITNFESQGQIKCVAQAKNPDQCPTDSIEYNRLFYFEVVTWDTVSFGNGSDLQLYINDIPLPYYPCAGVNISARKIFFKIGGRSDPPKPNEKTITDLIRHDFGNAKSYLDLRVGFGTRDGKKVLVYNPASIPADTTQAAISSARSAIGTGKEVTFFFYNSTKATVISIFAVACFIILLVVLTSKNLLNEKTGINKVSLRKFQLVFWTTLIAFAYFSLWLILGDTPVLPDSVIGLFVIGVSTTVVSSLISQDNLTTAYEAKNGLKGLLTDQNDDFSVGKLQFWMFTILFGVIFIYTALIDLKIYNFSTQELILMGASATGYLGNKAVKA